MKRHGALGVVVLAALAVGAWQNTVGLAGPLQSGPRTAFTAGHYLANAVFAAQMRMDGHPSTQTPLMGWPDVADFRALMWPAQLLGVLIGPLPAVNVFFVATYALNALGGWLLARALRLEPPAAAAVAGLSAVSPWSLETLTNGQLEQALVGNVALVWAVYVMAARGRWTWTLAVPMVTLLAALATPHLGLAACAGLPVYALFDGVGRRAEGARLWMRHLGLLGLAAAAALLANAYHSSNFSGGVRVFFPKGTEGHPVGVEGLPDQATLESLFWPPSGADPETGSLHPTWLGFLLPPLALLAAGKGRPAARAALGVAVALLVLSLGATGPAGIPLPYALLELLSPAVRQSSSAYRMVGGVTVALAVAAGALVRRPAWGLLLVALTWAEALGFATRPVRFARQDFTRDPVYTPFREHEGAVLDLPMVSARCPTPAFHYALEATFRHRPTPVLTAAPAVYPTLPGAYRHMVEASQSPECGPRIEALVHDIGFTGVVLHTHDRSCPVQKSFERCLVQAFGEGERAEGMRYWDPLPPMSEAARAFSRPFRPVGGQRVGPLFGAPPPARAMPPPDGTTR